MSPPVLILPAVTGGARWCASTLWLALAGACAAPPDELARAQWLRHTLVLDNQPFLDRDPEQAGGKLAKMGEALYPYFRGTAAQYARDTMQPGGAGYWPSAYETPETSNVALVGDSHPENVGTFASGREGEATIEFNDFDGSTFGPYGFDLRRLALGYWIAAEHVRRVHAAMAVGDQSFTLDEEHRMVLAQAVARGYAAEIAAVAADPRAQRRMTADEPIGAVLTELSDEAIDDGSAREELTEYTHVQDGRRLVIHADVEPPRMLEYAGFAQRVYEDTLVPLEPREQALVEALLSRYPDTLASDVADEPAALRLLGTARRLGAGIASYPAVRYYALVEGPSASTEDDVVLELKQTIDAVPMPGLPRFPSQPYYGNAERVVQMQRRLQSHPDADPWLGWAAAGADGYRVRWRTGYQRTLRIDRLAEDLAEGTYMADDLVVLAEVSGRLLARHHGFAETLDGGPAGPAIARAIAGDDEGLVEEVAGFVEHYAAQVVTDHATFVELLEMHGTNLGYVRR